MIGHAPKIKMMKEHGRHLRLDDEAEKRLLAGASACKWRQRTRELFRDIVILMRDTGDEKPKGTLPRAHRKSRLGKSRNLRAGQQNSGRTTTCSDEPSRPGALAYTVWHKGGRLGVSVQAFCCGSLMLNRSPVSRGSAASRPPEGAGPLLCRPSSTWRRPALLAHRSLRPRFRTGSNRVRRFAGLRRALPSNRIPRRVSNLPGTPEP